MRDQCHQRQDKAKLTISDLTRSISVTVIAKKNHGALAFT